MDTNEPGAAILNLFDQIVQRVKQTQPMRSDDKPLKGGSVYSMMTLGMPVDPTDYTHPWNPQGATIAQATTAKQQMADTFALAAAYKTSALCTTLLAVTDDQTYQEFPQGRSLDVAYSAILAGIQPSAADEPDDPHVVAAVAKANNILFLTNNDGTLSTNPTPMYQAYMDNTDAYGTATGLYAAAFAAAKADPNQMAIWPITSKTYQNAVTKAKNALIAGGAQTIESALDALASVGNPYQGHMVNAAKSSYKDWNLQLAGAVPASSPYCYILPSDWASSDRNACQGWQTLEVTSSSYSSISVAHAQSSSQYSWFQKASSIGGNAGASFLGFGSLGGSASHSSSSQGSQSSHGASSSSSNHTDAKGLHIKLTYALCTVQRPWYVGDLFYMKDWYLKGSKKLTISTGNINDQIQKDNQLLPMVPQRMLVIRNVSISATSWGSIKSDLTAAYGSASQGSSASASTQAASAGFSLGFISFGGGVSHSSSQAQGSGASFESRDSSGYFGTHFDGQTLTIPGAQILGWLCDIVPASAPSDDPMLAKPVKAPAAQVLVADPVVAR